MYHYIMAIWSFCSMYTFLKGFTNYKKQFGFARELDFNSEKLTDRIWFIFLFLICYVTPVVLILFPVAQE